MVDDAVMYPWALIPVGVEDKLNIDCAPNQERSVATRWSSKPWDPCAQHWDQHMYEPHIQVILSISGSEAFILGFVGVFRMWGLVSAPLIFQSL